MKTVLFCNLVPLKTGAYETLLAAVGEEFRRHGDEYVVVFAGEPISPVADSLRAAGVRWHVLPGWVAPKARKEDAGCKMQDARWCERSLSSPSSIQNPASSTQHPASNTQNPASSTQHPASSIQHLPASPAERVHPWAFVLPALKLIREERPDVVAVHFGNELPTLVASLLCRVMAWWTRLLHPASSIQHPASCISQPSTINHQPFFSPRWVWEQDQQIQDPGPISRRLSKLRLLGLGVDRFLAVYEGGRESMLKRGIPSEKISVIYNSVAPYTPVRPKGWLREELRTTGKMRDAGCKMHDAGWSESAPSSSSRLPPLASSIQNPVSETFLVTTGSLIPRKRIDFILRVCAGVGTALQDARCRTQDAGWCESASCSSSSNHHPVSCIPIPSSSIQDPASSIHPSWRLLIIGDGPEKSRLAAMAEELGIANRVHFLGLRNDIREILPECDIYLHASLAETCTYAITESMAAGIPAVVTEAGAAREQIDSGVSGYVLAKNDRDGFVQKLAGFMSSADTRMAAGKAAYARWRDRYCVVHAACQLWETYRNVAGAYRPRLSTRGHKQE